MTSLLLWFAADGKKTIGFRPASVYVASDSRISWDSGERWDHGKKVFAASSYPDIFGYCGDRFFAALILGQVVSAIDVGYLFERNDSAADRMSKVQQFIRIAWDSYPASVKESVRILHVSRHGDGIESSFYYQEHSCDKGSTEMRSSSVAVAPEGEYSRALLVRGTGKDAVTDCIAEWDRQYSNRHTSRAIFAAFCQAIRDGGDAFSGGAPQLAGLYRIGAGRSFGVIWNNARYFEGMRTLSVAQKDAIDWRNNSFEIVDQIDKRRKTGAARHIHSYDFRSK